MNEKGLRKSKSMSSVSQDNTKKVRSTKRKKVPDTRWYSNGVRIHPIIGVLISWSASSFRARYPLAKIRNEEYGRSLVEHLKNSQLIRLVEARVEIPIDLDERDIRLAKRQGGKPIWFPEGEAFAEFFRASTNDCELPVLRGEELIWPVWHGTTGI